MNWVVGAAIAFAAAVIAGGQLWIAHNKLRLDLFEKRLAVYKATKDYLAPLTSLGKPTPEQLLQFASYQFSGQQFLFGIDVAEFLHSLDRLGVFFLHDNALERAPAEEGDARAKLVERWMQKRRELESAYTRADEVFRPYMNFGHIRQRSIRDRGKWMLDRVKEESAEFKRPEPGPSAAPSTQGGGKGKLDEQSGPKAEG
jgi:hypothetical protein